MYSLLLKTIMGIEIWGGLLKNERKTAESFFSTRISIPAVFFKKKTEILFHWNMRWTYILYISENWNDGFSCFPLSFHTSLYLQQTISEGIFEIYIPLLYSKHSSSQLQDFSIGVYIISR